ncbi:MAG: bacillithiol biosynthesis deacetylase BshB1 [Novipirellula sp. JB048]
MAAVFTEPPAALAPTAPFDMLVVAPHPDDGELGMGGTIAKMISRGWRVGILDLTSGEPTPHGTETLRRHETNLASEALHLTWRGNAGLPNRSLQHTLEARELVASYFRVLKPRWVFAPYWHDAHPDHVAATELIEAARFWAKLSQTEMPGEPFHPQRVFYYYCIHLRLAATPNWIVDISDHWEAKLASVRAYHSQFIRGRDPEPPTFLDRLHDEASNWGRLINRRYGEPFATKEPLALDSLENII